MPSWLLVLGCGSEPVPPAPIVECPENTRAIDYRPVQGHRIVQCERRDGTRFGPFVEFHEDGTTRYREGTVKGVRKEGRFVTYHPDGTVRIEANYEANALHGAYREFDAEGQLVKEEVWEHGERVGDGP